MEDEQQALPGYGQTPPNPYGYPPYGYPPPGAYIYGYPQRQVPPGTNGLAIAAFVLGICGFLFVAPIVGLIFGIISLSAVRKSGQKGRGLAISGIVLSSAWIALFAMIVTIAVIATPDPARRDADGTVVSPGVVSVFALQPKDCFTMPQRAIGSTETKTSTLKVVPCSTAHDSEAVGSFAVGESSFPGAATLRTESTKQCVQRLNGFVPDPDSLPAGSHVQYLYPDQRSWDRGERQVMCFIKFPAATMTQSVYRDPSSYTVDQMVFLNAYNPLSEAVGALSILPESTDISVLQQRASDVSYAVQDEVAGLTAEKWSPEVQPAMDALIADDSAAVRVWSQVAASPDSATFFGEARRAYTALDVKDVMAVRKALGLTTSAPSSGGGISQTA